MARLAAFLFGLFLASPAFSAITYVGAGTEASAASTTSVTPTLHASTAEDDLIVIACGWHDNATGGEAMDTPTGYTLFRSEYTTNDNVGLVLYGKIAGSSESDPTVTVTGFGSGDVKLCQTATWRGTDLTIGTILAP